MKQPQEIHKKTQDSLSEIKCEEQTFEHKNFTMIFLQKAHQVLGI